MMRQLLLSVLFFVLIGTLQAQRKEAYQLFTASGKKITYGRMVKELEKKDVVLFGEYHNNPICHWLQLAVTRDLGKKRRLILGAEMFEADNQTVLNRYLSGAIDAKGLAQEARLWNNFKTDYAPLVNYAKANKLPFIATNIPRVYASLVNRGGFEALDTLSVAVKQWMAPLPVAYDAELPGYKNMLKMMGDHASPNFPKAQAIKDATMAYFIVKHFQPGFLFLHYNGTYHSDHYEGILWYLQRAQPQLRYATIATVQQEALNRLLPEHRGKADFILCVDASMTTTY